MALCLEIEFFLFFILGSPFFENFSTDDATAL